MDEEQILATILYRMHWHGYWGGRHTSIENLTHGFPGHLKGKVKKVMDHLLKTNWVIVKPKPDALHISLDTQFKPEICDFINRKT